MGQTLNDNRPEGWMLPSEKPNLTLYGIETQLLELLNFRESIEADPDMTPQEQQESLKACDESIAEYIRAEVKKCDGIARYLREFEARADTLKEEAARCTAMAKNWQKRYDSLEAMVIDIMQATKQTRIDGRHSVLQLKKNPPSVEVAQPELVPHEYQRVTITMTKTEWLMILRALPIAERLAMPQTRGDYEPMKDEIKKRLKEECGVCHGQGVVPSPAKGDPTMFHCESCNGTGRAGVPGCRLRTDGVRLEVK
jgi:hypothetical protein